MDEMIGMLPGSAEEFVKKFGGCGDFRPFAYYDKHLDCIRVQTMDCSFKEDRKNKMITVLSANHYETGNFAGFTLKGVRYMFEKLGLPVTGVHKLADLLDRLVRVFPDAAFRQIQANFRPILEEQNLTVELT